MPRSNPKALSIMVIDIGEVILNSDIIQKFIAKGHRITSDLREADVVVGPRCWRIDPKLRLGVDVSDEESLERQLEMMEKGVRAIKYPKEKQHDQTQNPTR